MNIRTSSGQAQRQSGTRLLATSLVALSAALGATAAGAQTIRQSPEAFVDSPRLPFAPAPPAVAALTTRPGAPAVHRLRSGEPIHTELQRWAQEAGWDFHWYPARSWRTMRDAVIDKADVADAVSEVIDILRSEGKPVQLRISDGNAVMEVLSTEVRSE